MRKATSIIAIGLILTVLAGGRVSDEKPQAKAYKVDGAVNTLLFTGTNESKDKQYYYALLKLQNRHPSINYHIKLVEDYNRDQLRDQFGITAYPALIVLNHGQVRVKIQGPQSWLNIYAIMNSNWDRPSSNKTEDKL